MTGLILAVTAGMFPPPRAKLPTNVVSISNATLATKPDTETHVRLIVDQSNRNALIKEIKSALEKRSGKKWSVTGGRGTAYGWIRIDAPPARQTWRSEPLPHNPGGYLPGKENWTEVDSGKPGGHTSPADRAELAQLLGLETVHFQGESIPAGHEYYREYLHRALYGNPGSFKGEPYWD